MYQKQIKKHITLEYKDGKSLFPELEDDKQNNFQISNNVYISNRYLDDYKFENVYIGRLFLYLLNIGTTYLKLKLGDTFDELFKESNSIQDFAKFMETHIIDNGPLNLKIKIIDILQAINSKDINRVYKTLEYLSNRKLRYDNFEEVKDCKDWQEWIKKFEFVHTNFTSQVMLAKEKGYLYVSINLGYIAFYNFILGKYGYSKDSLEKIVNIRNKNDLSLYLFLLPRSRLNKYNLDIKTVSELLGLDISKCRDNNCITRVIKSIIGRLNKEKTLSKDIELDFIRDGRNITHIVFNFKTRKEDKILTQKLFETEIQYKNQIDEKIKQDIVKYFLSVLADKSKVDNIFIDKFVDKVINAKVSINTFTLILKNISNNKLETKDIYNYLDIIKVLGTLKDFEIKYSSEELAQFINILDQNNRDINYLEKWIVYISQQGEIKNPKAYLLRVLKENAEPILLEHSNNIQIDPKYQEIISMLADLYGSTEEIILSYDKTIKKLISYMENKDLSIEKVKERLKEYRQQENSNIHLDIDGLVSGRKVKATVGLHSDNFLSQFENLD